MALTRTQLFCIWLAQFVEGVHTTLPYSLAVYLVRALLEGNEATGTPGPPPSEAVVGWMTGVLAACWSAAQFATSLPWGRASDAHGRKPLIIMSAASSGVSVLFFGTSRSYAAACAARLVGGAFNCTFVCIKCMIGEAAGGSDQARPMSLLALGWGFGTIVGPALGALASPCAPGAWLAGRAVCSPGSTLAAFPFLLPCAAASALSAVAVIWSACVLEETLPAKAGGGGGGRAASGARRSLARVSTFSSPYVGPGPAAGGSASAMGDLELAPSAGRPLLAGHELSSGLGSGPPSGLGRALGGSGLGERGGSGVAFSSPPRVPEVGTAEGAPGLPPNLPPVASLAAADAAERGFAAVRPRDPRLPASAFRSGPGALPLPTPTKIALPTGPGHGAPKPAPPSSPTLPLSPLAADAPPGPPWYRSRAVQLALAGYGCTAFLFNLLDELLPIYGSAPPAAGGLGMSPSQLAMPLAVGGVALIIYSQVGYFWVHARLGTRATAWVGLAGYAPLCVGLAAPSLLPPAAQGPALAALVAARACFANNAFTSAMVCVNLAAPPGMIGRVNGAGQALAAAVRAAGPALGGVAWGAAASVRPGGQFLPFAAVGVGLFAASWLYVGPGPGADGAAAGGRGEGGYARVPAADGDEGGVGGEGCAPPTRSAAAAPPPPAPALPAAAA